MIKFIKKYFTINCDSDAEIEQLPRLTSNDCIDLGDLSAFDKVGIWDSWTESSQRRLNLSKNNNKIIFSRKAELNKIEDKILDLAISLEKIQGILDNPIKRKSPSNINEVIQSFIEAFGLKTLKDDLKALKELENLDKIHDELDFLLFLKDAFIQRTEKVVLIKKKLIKSLFTVYKIDVRKWIKKRLRLISNYNIDEDIILFTTQRDLISNKIILLHGNNRIFKTYRQAS